MLVIIGRTLNQASGALNSLHYCFLYFR